jgi:hypothetical protein
MSATSATPVLPHKRLGKVQRSATSRQRPVNPARLAAQVLLVVGWRVAGQVGADHWLLDRLGTLGQPGRWFTRHRTPTTMPTPA